MRFKGKIPAIYAAWCLIAATLVIFVAFSFTEDVNIGSYTVKKGKFPETLFAKEDTVVPGVEAILDTVISTSIKNVNGPDSTIHNVLIFGDSMTHYLAMSISKYGTRNNYKVTSVTWVSSSIKRWSTTDKIKKYMDMVNPDFIIISLGANDVYLKNYDSKVAEVQKILAQIDTVPYIWVGPPMWKKDNGLYEMLEKTLSKERLFHIDEDFKMPRARDHIHPTHKGADLWADSLMRWIRFTNLPLLSEMPDTIVTEQDHKFIYLQSNE